MTLARKDPARNLRVALIPGDGIGPEVVSATRPILQVAVEQAGGRLTLDELDWGGARHVSAGAAMPPDAIETLRAYDAALFGAVGRRDVPDHLLIWGVILELRQRLDLYVNLRPVHAWPGIPTPLRRGAEADFVIVRENTEGEYTGSGGVTHRGTPAETAVEVAVHTRAAIERVAGFAFGLARQRRGVVQAITKSNVSRYGYVLWDEVVREVAARYPDVRVEFVLVDAMAARMIERPGSLDVVLASNLFGDILSDLAAPLQGGLGMAPSGNLRPDHRSPGIFEPVHGSAPDIAGTGTANPTGCILSAALMLEHCGLSDAATAVRAAVREALRDEAVWTPDLGGQGTTEGLATRVRQALDSHAAAEI